ncbi:hypothetical protein [Helicobacter sp. MIT 14-3879]|uniref:hypothetical protein n=1 Tax=Helicobacter sp. MIT 14-3879 TaxID=2040649 RepID=UPI000E1F585B|nr:hypothetical protein [Helicobacter sp. MIT 14-3879]RDU60607.1 hypothetical protein CQA44_10370 [Helicobacter sp. MIT 14-3879]
MKGAIFKSKELPFWHKLSEIREKVAAEFNLPEDTDFIEWQKHFILQTLKSYKPHPNGSGIKWSKEEKEAFVKLSYKEQRKMIVRKSELKSVLLPYVNVDYEPYKYSERISDAAKRAYQKAKSLLDAHRETDFNSLDSKIQKEIFHNLRVAYKEQYSKAGVELAKLLFKKGQFAEYREEGEIEECTKITKDLLYEKIPENAYMYYQLYKWCEYGRQSYASSYLKLNEEEARDCYSYALECVVWEAIDEETQKKGFKNKRVTAELWLAAAIKYQSPLAFYKAASNYSPNNLGFNEVGWYSIIMFQACLRCAIALGNNGAISRLEENYRLTAGDFPRSPLKVEQFRAYAQKSATQKGLINGLDPYFDEKFPPDEVIDLTSFIDNCAIGSVLNETDEGERWMGIGWAVKYGYIKDPRTKGSTLKSIKEYYLMMWAIIVQNFRTYKNAKNPLEYYNGYITYLRYSNLPYGLPSARPYVFPKEVLDLEIDFNKGLEEYWKKYKYERK